MLRRRSSLRPSRFEQLESRWLLAAIQVTAEQIAQARDLGITSQQIQRLTNPADMAVGRIKATSDLFHPLSSVPASKRVNTERELFPRAGVAFNVDWTDLKTKLAGAPMEFSGQKYQVSLPRPDGQYERFNVYKTNVLAPELGAQFPGIQTFIGQSIDTPGSTLAMDYTIHGLHASVYAPGGNSWYVDPYYKLESDVHVSYFRNDLQMTIKHVWAEEEFESDLDDHAHEEESVQVVNGTGPTLRTYMMAITSTTEYTAATGGTQETALGAITTNISRLNQIYERDFAVRFQLVANALNVIYAGADPFSNPGNASTTASANQSVTDSNIGSANYDIGHVFHRVSSSGLANGIAQLGSVGTSGQKAIAYSCHSITTGDFFVIDFVAHEMGHQFNGRHSFNSAGGGAGDSTSIAVEVGAGITIMGYAGLGTSSENVTTHSDAMFHAVNMTNTTGTSASQILSFISGGVGNSSATSTATGNFAPVANAGPNYIIPSRTPFILTGTATDANDPLANLTYSWEQLNGGNAVPMGTVNGVPCVPNPNPASEVTYGPAFRTYLPDSSPSRMFPTLSSVRLGRTYARGENVPTLARTMNFSLVVRDNFAGGGGTSIDPMTVTTVNTGTGFAITNLNSATTLQGNSVQEITWDVAGTTGSGINATNVNIYVSTDNGATFGTLVAGNVPNDGSQTITLPNISSNAVRILIQPTNNIFFDMNNAALTIQQASAVSAIPGAPDLDSGSDTGASSVDNITRYNNGSPAGVLSFNVGSTVAGALVEILWGANVIGSATASGTTTTVITNGALALPEGPVTITARQTEPSKTPSTSATSLNITVDTVSPGTNAGFDREQTQDVVVSYSEDVSLSLSAGDFTLTNLTTAQQIPITSFSAGASTATLGFTGILPNGHYQLDLPAANASDIAGNPLSSSLIFSFDVLAGDADGDGDVDFNDLLVVAQNYDGPNTLFSQGDFNFDDDIDFNDLLICAQNYGTALPLTSTFSSTPVARQSAAARVGLTDRRASGDNRSVLT